MTKVKQKFGPILLLALVSGILLLPQVNQHALILGADVTFHWNRFYDAMMQIKEGNFQYFISMYGFSQSGRIVNALYGPYVAYLNGLILLITGSWFKYQLVSDWLINLVAAGSMYYLLRVNRVKRGYSICLAIIFITTYAISTWVTGQQFLAWGNAIMPLGIAAATRMVRQRQDQINVLELALSVTLMIQTHVLSSLVLVIILAIFFVIGWWRSSDRGALLKRLALAVGLTILLTSNVWGAMLEVYSSNQLITPFFNPDPMNSGTVAFLTPDGRLSIAFAVLMVSQLAMFICYRRRLSLINQLVTVLGVAFFILSTQLLPWNRIFEFVPTLGLIQFPYRFLGPAIILLLLGVGLTLTAHPWPTVTGENTANVMLIILVIISLLAGLKTLGVTQKAATHWGSQQVFANPHGGSHRLQGQQLRDQFAGPDLGQALKAVWKTTPDYLPSKHNMSALGSSYTDYGKEIVLNNHFTKTVKNNHLIIRWSSKDTQPHLVSVVKYGHTKLTLNGRELSQGDYSLTDIGAVKVSPKVGENTLTVSYQPGHLFEGLLLLNWLAWLGLVVWLVGKRFISKQQVADNLSR